MALIEKYGGWLFFAAVVLSSSADAKQTTDTAFDLKGIVVSISDGDTINVRSDVNGATVNVRFSDIDAPEIGHGNERPGQPYGLAARDFLRSKVALHEEVTAKCYELDAHGRSVCRIYTSRGIDLNLAMVSAGYAQAYRRYLRDDSLIAVESMARKERLGIWADGAAVAPETWRRICWNISERQANAWCIEETSAKAAGLTKPAENVKPSFSQSLLAAVGTAYSATKQKTLKWITVRLDKVKVLFGIS